MVSLPRSSCSLDGDDDDESDPSFEEGGNKDMSFTLHRLESLHGLNDDDDDEKKSSYTKNGMSRKRIRRVINNPVVFQLRCYTASAAHSGPLANAPKMHCCGVSKQRGAPEGSTTWLKDFRNTRNHRGFQLFLKRSNLHGVNGTYHKRFSLAKRVEDIMCVEKHGYVFWVLGSSVCSEPSVGTEELTNEPWILDTWLRYCVLGWQYLKKYVS